MVKALPGIIEESERRFKEIKNGKEYQFYKEIIVSKNNNKNKDKKLNSLYISDNLKAMKDLLDKGYEAKLDLIYIDPPFFTKANYSHRVELLSGNDKYIIKALAYEDTWKNGFEEYLEMISLRLFFIKALLSEKGTVYVHLDAKAAHYVKIIMDCIFGKKRFLNEIIWSYKSGGTGRRSFSRKHDNILVYTKTDKYIFNPQKEKSYNRGLKPYNFKGVEEYEDNIGWYTLVNLKDVWNINIVGRTSGERVGYATQKPEELLERIILSSSNQTSIVGDFFAGSGTTAAVAQKLDRSWIISDLGSISESVIRRRLLYLGASNYEVFSKSEDINLTIDLDVEVVHNKDKADLEINLRSYNLDLRKLNLKEKDKIIIKKILKNNSLNLIEYIGIGYKDKEDNLLIIKEISKDLRSLKLESKILIKDYKEEHKDFYIKVIDAFGNSICKKVY